MGKIACAPRVEPVSDDEQVIDCKPDIINRHVGQPARRLAQEQAVFRLRGPRARKISCRRQRQPRVDDVFDDHN